MSNEQKLRRFCFGLIGLVVILAGVSILSACGANSSGGSDGGTGDITVIQVQVGGHTYNCVHTDGYYDDSNDCDFSRPVR